VAAGGLTAAMGRSTAVACGSMTHGLDQGPGSVRGLVAGSVMGFAFFLFFKSIFVDGQLTTSENTN